MAEQNFPDNILYELDNLEVLRGMNDETVDLIATDPPFNTKRNRAGMAGFYVDKWKWGDTGILPDQWKWNEVHPVWLEQIKDENEALRGVITAAAGAHTEDLAAFLCFLSVRLLECRRILKPNGSIYLHCDHSANGYIRMAMDAIFGRANFQNEIVWGYRGGGVPKTAFARKHDTILAYSKTGKPTFNRQYIQDSQASQDLVSGRGGVSIDGKERDLERGAAMPDWWTDINSLQTWSPERTGSPDQKPQALYERIVAAASNEGDLVLDPFAGCATTIMAARKLKRRWVGIDRRADARFHVVCRMMGIKSGDAEALQARPDLNDWITARMGEYEAAFSTSPPERTDHGESAAPDLPPVYPSRDKSILTHREMEEILVERFGLQCWGCSFVAPDPRYLELDHVTPKSDGGSDHLDNRALLCRPCNGEKSNKKTLSALRSVNRKAGHLKAKEHPIHLPSAAAWCRQVLAEKEEVRGRSLA